LREETASGQSRLDRTVEALRIAGSNAAKARADADAAEATAATLAQTLMNLETVLAETTSASQILHKEQQQVNATVAVAEAKLLQKEGEIIRAKKDLMVLLQSNQDLEAVNCNMKKERDEFALQVNKYEQELDELKREKLDLVAVEKARKDRADKVEQEWHKSQTMLVEVTSGQAAAKQTQAILEESIASLQKTNRDLHATLLAKQHTAMTDKQRISETVIKVEKEAQRLRIAAEASDEEMARLKVEKTATDKQLQQLKARLATSERILKEHSLKAISVATPLSSSVSPVGVTTPSNSAINAPNQLSFHLPPLSTGQKMSSSMTKSAITEKENLGVDKGDLCCICYKPSLGIMKTCQCGGMACHRKAHANCIKLSSMTPGPSVSHPGTPAPKLPVVLCDSVLSKIRLVNVGASVGSAAKEK
jgi:hypothetical protein